VLKFPEKDFTKKKNNSTIGMELELLQWREEICQFYTIHTLEICINCAMSPQSALILSFILLNMLLW
jgi:hypothetical protein